MPRLALNSTEITIGPNFSRNLLYIFRLKERTSENIGEWISDDIEYQNICY
ncbi:MAG: hypothetical protein ACK4OM_06800 [Alphaproteobacteria bacterium]